MTESSRLLSAPPCAYNRNEQAEAQEKGKHYKTESYYSGAVGVLLLALGLSLMATGAANSDHNYSDHAKGVLGAGIVITFIGGLFFGLAVHLYKKSKSEELDALATKEKAHGLAIALFSVMVVAGIGMLATSCPFHEIGFEKAGAAMLGIGAPLLALSLYLALRETKEEKIPPPPAPSGRMSEVR